jgi:hypothetical protein
VTLNESWFYLHTDHELIWEGPDAEIPERDRHTVQSQKGMLTIVCNHGGFHLVNILPKGFKFNASYYVTQILDPLFKWRRTQVGRTNRKLIVHAGNSRPHTAKMTMQFMEQNSMQRAPDPAYSPDLTPSDFYFFGYVKQLLSGCQFADQDSLLQAVSAILVGIEKVTLESVFHNRMERLCQYSATCGEYIKQKTFYINRITDNTVGPEMLMDRWDTLYDRVHPIRFDSDSNAVACNCNRVRRELQLNKETNHGSLCLFLKTISPCSRRDSDSDKH